MFPDLKNKTVVVTGAGQGLGRSTAEAFVDAGSEVLVVARSRPDWLDGRQGPGVDWLECDIEDLGPMERWLGELEARGGRVHVLVNNAGVLRKGDLIDTPAEDFDHVMNVNVRATFLLAQTMARHMSTRGGGVILNAASYAVTLASISHGVYAASKAALFALTRSMAAEWAPHGIRVNAYSPGVVPTRMTEPAIAAHEAAMKGQISLHRLGTGQEVASGVLFLASDASSYITGVNLDLSGGKLIVQNPGAAWD